MPMERRLPRVRVRSRQLHSLIGQRLVLQIDSWDRTSNYPSGHIVRVLGPCNDLKCAAGSADGNAELSGSDLHLESPPGGSQACSIALSILLPASEASLPWVSFMPVRHPGGLAGQHATAINL